MEEFLLFCLFFQEDCSPVSQVILLGILGPLEVSNAKWTWCDLTHFWCDVMRFMSRSLGEHAFKWSFDNPSQGMWRILEGINSCEIVWDFRTFRHRNSPFVSICFLMIFCCLTHISQQKHPGLDFVVVIGCWAPTPPWQRGNIDWIEGAKWYEAQHFEGNFREALTSTEFWVLRLPNNIHLLD